MEQAIGRGMDTILAVGRWLSKLDYDACTIVSMTLVLGACSLVDVADDKAAEIEGDKRDWNVDGY